MNSERHLDRQSDESASTWLRRRFAGSPRSLWFTNLTLLVAAVIWVFADPRLHQILSRGGSLASHWNEWPIAGMLVLCLLAALLLVWLLLGLWLGTSQFRQLRSLIVIISLISLWLGYAMNCQSIAWHGRRVRVSPYVATVEKLCTPLEQQWPQIDGTIQGIGPFMAYPIGRPTTLILLTPPTVTEDGPSISAIERSSDGAIRFELSDLDGRDWLEWHPQSLPSSHIGGLGEEREMTRFSSLSDNWFLVRYRDPDGGAS